MVIDELGHRQQTIAIFKVDIEGSEYTMVGEFFKHPFDGTDEDDAQQSVREIPYIRPIHLVRKTENSIRVAARELFELFRFNNYAIFHKEVNFNYPKTCHEYAFLRLYRKFFVPSE